MLWLPFRICKRWSWVGGAVTVAGRPEWIARGQEGRVEHASQADNQDGSGTIKIGQLHGSEWPSAGNGAVNGQKKDRRFVRSLNRHGQGEMHNFFLGQLSHVAVVASLLLVSQSTACRYLTVID